MTVHDTPRSRLLPWLVWGVGVLLFSYGWFHRVAPGVMVDTLMREFAMGGVVLGNLSAIYFYAYGIGQIPAGLIVDAYGSRRILFVSALCCAIGSVVFAHASGIASAYAGRLLVGLGAGSTFVIALNLAAVWFPRKRLAMLSGLTLSFGVAGSMAGQVPLAWGVEAFGWRSSMYSAAVIAAVLCVASWLILRLPEPGLRPVAGAANPAGGVLSVLKRRDTWVLTVAGGCTMMIMLTFGGLWGVPWLVQIHGFSRPDAAFAITLNALGWGLGSPLIGGLSDRLGRRRLPYVGAMVLSVAAFAALVFAPDLSALEIKMLLFAQGLGTGGVVLIFTSAHERFAGGREGLSAGIINTGIMVGAATLQPAVGWVLDRNWHGAMAHGARVYDAAAYQGGFLLLLAGGMGAVIAGLMMPETARR